MEDALKCDPYAYGEKHPDHAGNGCWIHEFPRFKWSPFVAVIYTVDEDAGVVMLWSLRAA
jgi:hypothetical protein